MSIKKNKGLGLGLEALLGPSLSADPTAPNVDGNRIMMIPVTSLQSGIYQPRAQMDEGGLYELAESIRSQGIIQPILVRSLKRADANPASPQVAYEIIAGDRRWRAARIAGLTEVPVLVRDVEHQHAAILALIENMQREDLNALEEAQGLDRLIREFGLSHDDAAKAVGRSRSATTNLLRLLNLGDPVKAMLKAGDLEMGHARALLSLSEAHQIAAAHQIVAKKMPVREAEKLVRKIMVESDESKPADTLSAKDRDTLRVEEALSDLLAASVTIECNKTGSGRLSIAFSSLDELNGIVDKIRRQSVLS